MALDDNRIEYLDYARGFAVFTMFLQHGMLVHEYSGGNETVLGGIFLLLGTAPAAPIFLLLMGVFLMKSKSSIQKNILRGLKLLLLGYALNFFRFTVPLWLSGEADFPPGESPIEHLFAVDIFHVAGLALIIGSIIKKYCSRIILGLIALSVVVISPFLWYETGLMSPLSLLFGNYENVYFPFFPWFFYPLVGMIISPYAIAPAVVEKNMKYFFSWLFFLLIACFGLIFITPIGDYVRSGAGVHFGILLFCGIWFTLCRHLSKTSFSQSWVARMLTFWSKNVTGIYCIQWILFGWSTLLFGMWDQPDYIAAFISVGVLVLTHMFISIFQQKKICGFLCKKRNRSEASNTR